MSSRPNLKLLAKVANVVELIPPEHFDMSDWFSTQQLSPTSEFCKTVGCAIGKACEMGVFKGVEPVLTIVDYSSGPRPLMRFAVNGQYNDIHAAVNEAVLQLRLHPTDWSWLFTSRHVMGKNPRQVAARIRKFIRDYPQSSRRNK